MDYIDLQAAVGDFLSRSDLYPQIPTFIALAEAKMSRRLRVRRMVVNSTAIINAEFETVPADFGSPISMKFSVTDVPEPPLDCISPDAMAYRKSQGDYEPGTPRRYSVVGNSFEFSPVPDTSYTAFLIYYALVPALSVASPTNWLIATFPDAYLYGALEQAGLFLGEGRTEAWGALFEAALTEIQAMDRRETFGARLEPRPSLVV